MDHSTETLDARALPQVSGHPFLIDSGLETTLVFHDGIDLPHFAAFTLLDSPAGRERLRAYYRLHLDIAEEIGAGFILDGPTWRASSDWGPKLGYDAAGLARINRESVSLMLDLREGWSGRGPAVISTCMGPRGDGYAPDSRMTAIEAQDYHSTQVDAIASAPADMINVMTMTYAAEAVGIARAARSARIPVALSFTVETDGRLPDGQPLGEAISEVDAETDGYPAYFMINCAHPDHIELAAPGAWTKRVRGLRANASRQSHAELDACETLDDGDPEELGRDYLRLKRMLPNLNVFGGCCGTDHRHIRSISETLLR